MVKWCTNKFNIQQSYTLPTLYLCVLLFVWEQIATCATYSKNWLVFITEMKSVYSPVRTGSLNKAVSCSLQPGHYSSLTAPNFQPTATQERDDQCGNQHYSCELLMMGIVVPETCWAYKK